MGCCTTVTDAGVGQVSLQHNSGAGMVWVGLESYSPASIASGASISAGTHIVYIDDGHMVDIQVASIDTIRVHNSAPFTVAGNVTLIW